MMFEIADHVITETLQSMLGQRAKQIKSSTYFKTQIEEKVPQIIGAVGLDLYLPPWLEINQYSEQQPNYFDSEVQYFIVNAQETLAKSTKFAVIHSANQLLNTDLSIANECQQKGDQEKCELFVQLQTDEKQATVTVFCFKIQNEELVRIKDWKKLPNQVIVTTLDQVFKAATYCEFTGLKLKQLAMTSQQILINVEVETYTLTFSSPIAHALAAPQLLFDKIKNTILLECLKNPNFGAIQPLRIQLKADRFSEVYSRLNWPDKAKLLQFCRKQLKLTLNQLSIVSFKPGLFLKNICELVSQYVKSSIFFSRQVHRLVKLIVEEAQEQKVFQYFDSICAQIDQTKELTKSQKLIRGFM